MMRNNYLLSIFFILIIFDAQAYKVWTSGIKVPREVIDNPKTTENIRKKIQGHNLNFTSFNRREDAEGRVGDRLPMRTKDWNRYFETLRPEARGGLAPMTRTSVFHPDFPKKMPTLAEKLPDVFKPNEIGFRIDIFMPYDNFRGEDREKGFFGWTIEEFQEIRDFLNTYQNGKYSYVKLARDIRNWAFQRKDIQKEIEAGIMEVAVFEGTPEKFYNNTGKRRDMLDYFFKSKDKKVQDMEVMFQIPVGRYKGLTGTEYEQLRNFVKWIGDTYGQEVLKGDRVTFQLTTYHIGTPWIPELNPNNNNRYNNTINGIALSLLEQEPLFSGCLKNADGSVRKPTKADADNTERIIYTDNEAPLKNNKPIANFVSPIAGTIENGYTELIVEVDASDPDGDKISATLRVDGQVIRIEKIAPYEWGHQGSPNPSELLNLEIGEHILRATITDDKGEETVIEKNITVTAKNQAPTVTLTSPIEGAVYTFGETINLSASATDPDGNLDKVNFKINGIFYKTDNQRPFENTFTPDSPGNYKIAARAFDEAGLSFETEITVTVNATLSSENFTKPNQFSKVKLYPSPTSSILNISGLSDNENTVIEIIDVTGKILISEKLATDNTSIDVSKFAKGIYFSKILSGSAKKIFRFIKK